MCSDLEFNADSLNEEGKKGWELVQVSNTVPFVVYFKRPINE